MPDVEQVVGHLDLGPRWSRLTDRLQAIRLLVVDFDGVLTDNCVYVDSRGNEMVRCWRGDGIGLSRIRSLGIRGVIVSTEKSRVVAVRAKKLGLEFRSGVDDKGLVVEGLQARMALQPKCVAFVGNDVNDLPAFERVGLRIAVGDAHSEVKIKADVVTQLPGGFGAVREVCDALFASRGGISPG